MREEGKGKQEHVYRVSLTWFMASDTIATLTQGETIRVFPTNTNIGLTREHSLARPPPRPCPHPCTARCRGDCCSHPAARVTTGLAYSVAQILLWLHKGTSYMVTHFIPLSFFSFRMYCPEYRVSRISVRVTPFVAGAETKITLRMYDTSVIGGTRRRH